MSKGLKEYLLDVSQYPSIAYVPYENGIVYSGMVIITRHCPGKLVGVFHIAGQKEADLWVAEHPDWHNEYKSR